MVSRKKILFFTCLFYFFIIPTSLSSYLTMNTSIALAPNVFITPSTDKTTYCPPELINISTLLENKGNLGATGNLTNEVFDPYGGEFISKSWHDVLLNPSEKEYFFMNHTVTEDDIAGVYTLKSNFAYGDESKYNKDYFRIKTGIGTLTVSPSSIEITVMPGDTATETLYFWLLYACRGAWVYLNTSVGLPGDWVTFSVNPLFVPTEEWNKTSVVIYVDLPWNATPADYHGFIYAYAEDQQVSIPLTVHVLTAPIFDLSVEIPPEKKVVYQGEDVYAKITITKYFPPEPLDVNMTYKIENSTNVVFDEKKETIAIEEKIEKIEILHIPSDAPPGVYTFYAILEYKGISVIAYDIFEVKVPPLPPTPPPPPPPPVPRAILYLNVSQHMLTVLTGNVTGFIAEVANVGNKQAELLRLLIKGVPAHWTTITPPMLDLAPGEKKDYKVLIKVPADAKEGIYELTVKASNEVESNEEMIILVVGKNVEALAGILYEELKKVKSVAVKSLRLTCLDISDNLILFNEIAKIEETGVLEHDKREFEKAIDIFGYVIRSYEKITTTASILMNKELEKLKPFSFPPYGARIIHNMQLLRSYAKEKKYHEFCETLEEIKKLSFYSTTLLVMLISSISATTLLATMAYIRRREWEVARRLEKIKERIGA